MTERQATSDIPADPPRGMDRLERWFTPRTPLSRHALAVLFVVVAFGLTLLLRTVTPRFHFILFVPAVILAAWFGGRGPGLTASAVTLVLAAAYLLPAGAIIEELAWLLVAGIVVVVTSTLTAAHRRAEARLAELLSQESARRREAESLSQLKSDVLAQIAHELRQPLGAIMSAAQVLEKAPTVTVLERGLGVITRQTEHLGRLVDDLLDASRLQRGELKLQTSDVDLCEIVEDVRHVIVPAVTERRIELSSSIPACPLVVRADATRVRQILSNLLSNAAKYTGHGGRIDLVLEEAKGDGGGVVIRVRDTGRGIPPERLTQIFEMFQTGHGEGTGLGVGLAIVKGLVEMHGGSVQATSAGPGQGSEFIVRLPAGAQRPAA